MKTTNKLDGIGVFGEISACFTAGVLILLSACIFGDVYLKRWELGPSVMIFNGIAALLGLGMFYSGITRRKDVLCSEYFCEDEDDESMFVINAILYIAALTIFTGINIFFLELSRPFLSWVAQVVSVYFATKSFFVETAVRIWKEDGWHSINKETLFFLYLLWVVPMLLPLYLGIFNPSAWCIALALAFIAKIEEQR